MSERKRCVRCDRAIDDWAKICPFCNWDQTNLTPPPPKVVAAPVVDPRKEEELALKKKAAIAGAGVLLFFLAFAVGMIINRADAPKYAPEPISEQAEKESFSPALRADTPLVPVGAGGVEQPITSAPAAAPDGSLPNEYSRTDATAVSALEYARMAQRARAERKRPPSLVDPRSLSGPAYAQAPLRRRTAPATPVSATPPPAASAATPVAGGGGSRTRPIPEYQPIPPIQGSGTAKLTLLVGTDGRVKHINVEQALGGGNTAKLIGSVQRWRFRPATENGHPVSAPYSVNIEFD